MYLLALLDNDLRAAKRARNAEVLCDLTGGLALGVSRTSVKVAEASRADNHRASAGVANHIGGNFRLVVNLLGFLRRKRLGISATRIVRASGELTKAAVLDYHSRTALVANNIRLFNGQLILRFINVFLRPLKRLCEIVVEDRLILLRYRPEDNDWLYFGVVFESEELSREILEKALSLNLFGAETLGLHLGRFNQSLILSGTSEMEGLNAETLAQKLLFLARQINTLAEKLGDNESSQEESISVVSSPLDTVFTQV